MIIEIRSIGNCYRETAEGARLPITLRRRDGNALTTRPTASLIWGQKPGNQAPARCLRTEMTAPSQPSSAAKATIAAGGATGRNLWRGVPAQRPGLACVGRDLGLRGAARLAGRGDFGAQTSRRCLISCHLPPDKLRCSLRCGVALIALQCHWQRFFLSGISIAISNRAHLDYQLEQFMEAV